MCVGGPDTFKCLLCSMGITARPLTWCCRYQSKRKSGYNGEPTCRCNAAKFTLSCEGGVRRRRGSRREAEEGQQA